MNLCEKNNTCPVDATLSLIGGKYKSLILWHLAQNTLRFSELKKLIPNATPKMLTQQLRELELSNLVTRVHKYLVAYRSLILEDINKGLLPAYTAGLISLDKQFGTIGLNGVLEGYEYLATNGSTMSYDKYLCDMLGTIK